LSDLLFLLRFESIVDLVFSISDNSDLNIDLLSIEKGLTMSTLLKDFDFLQDFLGFELFFSPEKTLV